MAPLPTRPLLCVALLATAPLLGLALVPPPAGVPFPPSPPSPPVNYGSSSSDVVFPPTETSTVVPHNIIYDGHSISGGSSNYSTAAYAAAYAQLAAVAEIQQATLQTLPFDKTTVGSVNLCPDGTTVRCRVPGAPRNQHTLRAVHGSDSLLSPLLPPHQRCRVLRCVDYSIGRDNSSRNGDGFSRIDLSTALGQQAFQAVRAQTVTVSRRPTLPPNSVFKGVNQWLLQTITAMANISLTVEVVRLDSATYYAVDRNKELMNAFVTHNYDCVLTATFLTAEKLPYMAFMQSMQPYGFQVVTNKAVTLSWTLTQKLWTWTLVFTSNVWLAIAASMVVVGTAMWWLEKDFNDENFGEAGDEGEEYPRSVKMIRGIGHGLYFSFAGLTSKTEEFAPKTAAGRLLGICQAFAIFLLIAFYTANLAAILIQGAPSVQPIKSIADFVSLNAPACILAKSEYINFMALNYPTVKTTLIPGSIYSLLDAILDGTCLGAVAPDVVIKYALGPDGDAAGAYCGLETKGELLNAAFYAIPFNPASVAPAVVAGLNTLALQLLANGSYTAQAALNFPDAIGRTQCEVAAAVASLTSALTLTDMSGIFFVQALGLAVAFLLVAFLKVLAMCRLRPGAVIEDLHHWPARTERERRCADAPLSAAGQIRALLEAQDEQAAILRRRTEALLATIQEPGGSGAVRGVSPQEEVKVVAAGKAVELATP